MAENKGGKGKAKGVTVPTNGLDSMEVEKDEISTKSASKEAGAVAPAEIAGKSFKAVGEADERNAIVIPLPRDEGKYWGSDATNRGLLDAIASKPKSGMRAVGPTPCGFSTLNLFSVAHVYTRLISGARLFL